MTLPAPLFIRLHPGRLRLVLVCLVAVLSTLGLAAEVGYALADRKDPYSLVLFTGLSYEQNLPTWAASSLLLGCALLLWLIARTGGAAWRGHWYLLSALFAYISLDETTELHEEWSNWVSTGDILHGWLYYSWVVPAALIVLGLGVLYCKFLLHLPGPSRRRFILAAVLYIGGALVMELPLGYWAKLHGSHNLVYGLIDWLEETLELAGASLFFYALVLHLLASPAGLTVTLAPTDPGTNRAGDKG